MIESFFDKRTAALFMGLRVKSIHPQIQDRARAKLKMLDNAHSLADINAAPGNKLEALSGNRKRQHSIRVNAQWRLCFVWKSSNAHDVEFVDYH